MLWAVGLARASCLQGGPPAEPWQPSVHWDWPQGGVRLVDHPSGPRGWHFRASAGLISPWLLPKERIHSHSDRKRAGGQPTGLTLEILVILQKPVVENTHLEMNLGHLPTQDSAVC